MSLPIPTPEMPYAGQFGVCPYCGIWAWSGGIIAKPWDHYRHCKNHEPPPNIKFPETVIKKRDQP